MIRILDLEAADFDFESESHEEGLEYSEHDDLIDNEVTIRAHVPVPIPPPPPARAPGHVSRGLTKKCSIHRVLTAFVDTAGMPTSLKSSQ